MTKADSSLITQAEYARRRGCSREAVRKAITDGRINAFGPDKLVDADLADAQWVRNTRSRVVGTSPAAAPAPQCSDPPVVASSSYQAWRCRREAAEAQSAELALAELRGELIRRADMEHIVGGLAAALKESVLQIKARLAPLLAAESDIMKISAMLDAELRAALNKAAG